ncbi:polyketide cyclase, partial [Halobacteriales archaeon QH_7_66_37]
KITAEAERVVERMVADLEGQRREVTLDVHEAPDSV